MTKYKPIACSLHDQLEDTIVRRVSGTIEYDQGGKVLTLQDRIVDWVNEGNEEFAITASGSKIRLDNIISLFGIPFRQQHC